MADMSKAHAGARLARLRRLAKELESNGWLTSEPKNALEQLTQRQRQEKAA